MIAALGLLVGIVLGVVFQPDVPLGLTVRGQADGAMVIITGLVAGMTLSTGNALGANGWQTFRRVTLPNVKWALLSGIILCTARAMG